MSSSSSTTTLAPPPPPTTTTRRSTQPMSTTLVPPPPPPPTTTSEAPPPPTTSAPPPPTTSEAPPPPPTTSPPPPPPPTTAPPTSTAGGRTSTSPPFSTAAPVSTSRASVSSTSRTVTATTPPFPNDPGNNIPSSNLQSNPAIVGIVLGVIGGVVFLLLLLLGWRLWRTKQKQRKQDAQLWLDDAFGASAAASAATAPLPPLPPAAYAGGGSVPMQYAAGDRYMLRSHLTDAPLPPLPGVMVAGHRNSYIPSSPPMPSPPVSVTAGILEGTFIAPPSPGYANVTPSYPQTSPMAMASTDNTAANPISPSSLDNARISSFGTRYPIIADGPLNPSVGLPAAAVSLATVGRPLSVAHAVPRSVRWEHVPMMPDEIHLRPGDDVEIEHAFKDGWAMGRNKATGEYGMFPTTHLHSSPLSNAPDPNSTAATAVNGSMEEVLPLYPTAEAPPSCDSTIPRQSTGSLGWRLSKE